MISFISGVNAIQYYTIIEIYKKFVDIIDLKININKYLHSFIYNIFISILFIFIFRKKILKMM